MPTITINADFVIEAVCQDCGSMLHVTKEKIRNGNEVQIFVSRCNLCFNSMVDNYEEQLVSLQKTLEFAAYGP